jgi:hypothetical protein
MHHKFDRKQQSNVLFNFVFYLLALLDKINTFITVVNAITDGQYTPAIVVRHVERSRRYDEI